jgi:(2Fe-2S) ferredoxin
MSEPVYHKHIFICVNQRPEGERRSCGEQHGMALVNAFKQSLKSRKLTIRVRAQKSGCLDICNFGPTMVVYPEGVFYVNVQLDDVEEIIESHILGNKPVQRLLLANALKQ